MNGDRAEQFELLLNAHLDGRLTGDEAARFRRLIDDDAELRAEFELQSAVDGSLRRLYTPPAAARSGVNGKLPQAAIEPKPAAARPWRRSRRLLPLAAAAAIAVTGLLIYRSMPTADEPQFIMNELQLTQRTPDAFYQVLKARGFDTDWDCDDDRDFAAFVHRRLKHGLMLARAPENVQVLGLAYGWTLSRKSVHLSARVDGQGVVVFIDRIDNPDRQAAAPTCKLNVYERRTDRFVLFEMSPLDRPHLLDLFHEVDVPEEWLKRGYGGIDGGRIRKMDKPASGPSG